MDTRPATCPYARVVYRCRSERPPGHGESAPGRDATQGHSALTCDPHPGRDDDAAPGIGTQALVLQARENALALVGVLGGEVGREGDEGEAEEEGGATKGNDPAPEGRSVWGEAHQVPFTPRG